jgi:1-acyl-sn-glycerol-3-phosphate acyltransferase
VTEFRPDHLGADEIELPRHRAYRLLRPIARRLVSSRWDLRIHGEEHVPKRGPVIISPNHTGFIDGPLVGIIGPRPVHALTKQEAFQGGFGVALRISGQIPVDRHNPDPAALRRAVAHLRAGDAVGVFPEGTRGAGELERLKRGAAYLALVTGAPVVPAAFFGTRLPGGPNHSVPPKGSRFDVVYGTPVYLDQQPWPRRRDSVREAHEVLAEHLRRHLLEAQVLTGR